MTFNEPMVSAYVGHFLGHHAPGHKDRDEMLSVAHHLLLAHGWTTDIIRVNAKEAQVGIVLNLSPVVPASPSEADAEQARIIDGWHNRWYLDPLAGRGYPQDIQAFFDREATYVQPGDMDVIATPIDFLGINYYTRILARSESVPEENNAPRELFPGDETEMGWEVYPQGLTDILERVWTEYSFPGLYVTENGAAFVDTLDPDGQVNDVKRNLYLRDHVQACWQAIEKGVPLRGYFLWSFLDNFEWAYGYSKRFGIVYVDFETLDRIPKRSALWYRDMIRQGGINTDDEPMK
jgi:beta-glucosidase